MCQPTPKTGSAAISQVDIPTPQEIDAAIDAWCKTTPRIWRAYIGPNSQLWIVDSPPMPTTSDYGDCIICGNCGPNENEYAASNAQFIAAIHNDFPRYARALQIALRAVEMACDAIGKTGSCDACPVYSDACLVAYGGCGQLMILGFLARAAEELDRHGKRGDA